jgi:pimeloyl-ACP methyl ester carboxylesterase
VLRFAAVTLGLYLVTCVVAVVVSRRFLFPAPARAAEPLADAHVLESKTSDGVVARALFFTPSATPDATLVFFHGNGEIAEDNVGLARELVSHGYAVALAEYRGYGLSRMEGAPSEPGIYADAEAVIASLGVARDRMVLMGFSLGTGVAVEMAARGHGHAMVLLAPYTAIPEVAARWVPVLPMRFIMRDKLDSRSKAAAIDMPVLVAHGDADQVVPFDMGETLAHTFPHGQLVTVPGGHHMDMFAVDDRLMPKILTFLTEVMPL